MDTLDLGLEVPAKRPMAKQERLSAVHRHNLSLKAEIYSAPVGDMPRTVFVRSFATLIRIVTLAPYNPEANSLVWSSLDSLPSQLSPSEIVTTSINAIARFPHMDHRLKLDPHVVHIQKHGGIIIATSETVGPVALVRCATRFKKANLEFPVLSDRSDSLCLKSGDLALIWSGDSHGGQRFPSEVEKLRGPLTAAVTPELNQVATALSKKLAGLGMKGCLLLVRHV